MIKQTWVCPKCKNKVVLHINPTATPHCQNYEKHRSTRYVEMKQEEE